MAEIHPGKHHVNQSQKPEGSLSAEL